METNENTLADLIRAALDTREDELEVLPSYENGEMERAKLALNALTERLEEIIDERITQMLFPLDSTPSNAVKPLKLG